MIRFMCLIVLGLSSLASADVQPLTLPGSSADVQIFGTDRSFVTSWHLHTPTVGGAMTSDDSVLSAVWLVTPVTISDLAVNIWSLSIGDGTNTVNIQWEGHGDTGLIPMSVTLGGVTGSYVRISDPAITDYRNFARVSNFALSLGVGLFISLIVLLSWWRKSWML